MPRSHGLTVEKPVSFWLKKVDFNELFKALGKAAIDVSFGKYDSTISNLVDAISVFKFKEEAGQLAWFLIYRSMSRAMFMLIKENQSLIREATKGFQSLASGTKLNEENLKEIAGKLDYAVDARDIVIEESFFENPREFSVIQDLKKPFAAWLENFGLTSAQAQSISGRLPSYFVLALNTEWRLRRKDYDLIVKELPTPFTKAAQNEQDWSYYYADLQKRIDESLFGEAFSLKQIYIPLRGYYEEKKDKSKRDNLSDVDFGSEKVNKIVVNIEKELEDWVNNSDEKDAIRVLNGGPGYGKSSIAKIFAARQTENNNCRVLFIPLHLFEPTDDLTDALNKFIEEEGYFSNVNFLNPKEGEKRLLLIFDGLDELTMQGKVGNEVAQEFVKEVQRKVHIYNQREPRLKVLICGRDIAVQAGATNLDRKTRILNLLPYFVDSGKRVDYKDSKKLLSKDQRDDWWVNYGKVNGIKYNKLPKELDKSSLTEITALPLLNYLVALSYTRGKLDFAKQNNLNDIYQDLLESVYQRENVWADKQHTALEGISEENFFRIFEEIALAAWHSGESRKVTVKEIENHCERSGLKPLLEKFQERAKDGVSSLLVAFYFKKSGIQAETLNETFEFTHKSFGEYLTARRIILGVKLITDEIERRQKSYGVGWDDVQSLTHWVELCGRTQLDEYLLNFIYGEVALEFQKSNETVTKWQSILGKLFSHVLQQGIPMEKLADNRPIFKEEIRQARNAEETLLAVLNACARSTKDVLTIDSLNSISFSWWLNWVNTVISKNIILNLLLFGADLAFANLSGASLKYAKLHGANLMGANLLGANLNEANLVAANLMGANLFDAKLQHAHLINAILNKANLVEANLAGANLTGAKLYGANLEKAVFITANLSMAELHGANLFGADLSEAILDNANLTEAVLYDAILDGTSFAQTKLVGAIWKDGRRIIGGNYPDLIFEDS